MGIVETISRQMRDALRGGDRARLAALRNIRAALVTEMKRDNAETLSDDACVGVLRRLEKQRRESIEAFERGGRGERAAAERADLEVVREFLPGLADEETTRAWVREAIETTGAARPGDLGRVMGAVMKAHRGDVDGDLARRIAEELLA